jgi:hypothetical protein
MFLQINIIINCDIYNIKKVFMKKEIINEEEKNRILEMHKTATKNLYLLRETVEQNLSVSLDSLLKTKKDWTKDFYLSYGGAPNTISLNPKINGKVQLGTKYQISLPGSAQIVGVAQNELTGYWPAPQINITFGNLNKLVNFNLLFGIIPSEPDGVIMQFYSKNTKGFLTHEQSYKVWDETDGRDNVAKKLGYNFMDEVPMRFTVSINDSEAILGKLNKLKNNNWKSMKDGINIPGILNISVTATKAA